MVALRSPPVKIEELQFSLLEAAMGFETPAAEAANANIHGRLPVDPAAREAERARRAKVKARRKRTIRRKPNREEA